LAGAQRNRPLQRAKIIHIVAHETELAKSSLFFSANELKADACL
jgi:hypothetical protein